MAAEAGCVGGTRHGARLLVTGHESGQVLLWDRRAMRDPLWAVAPSSGQVWHQRPGGQGGTFLRRVHCGDRINRAVVSFGYDAQRPWLLYSGHFDGSIYKYDFSSSASAALPSCPP